MLTGTWRPGLPAGCPKLPNLSARLPSPGSIACHAQRGVTNLWNSGHSGRSVAKTAGTCYPPILKVSADLSHLQLK